MKYEVGICIKTGEIVWVHGGVPCGSYSDLRLAREAYVQMVEAHEKTIADDGYKDRRYFIYPSLRPECGAQLKSIMARHETLNHRLKEFKVLDSPFRHDTHLHPRCFHAVTQLVQLMLVNGEPLYSLNL